ncbi:MAG: 6,7-dimethyl-8-ribityllumazine synthase [Gluconacetobacter diazotrophicus]|nr:6,7-dimethyl-8-ribityllumazine synthase [Gluconacetobacter diazotrophicus]
MATNTATTVPVLRFDDDPAGAPRLALVVSRFNEPVTGGLRRGALEWLGEHGIAVREDDRFDAPGAFELPVLAQALARTGRYEGVICLGCVIKGDTAHFEFIALGAAVGLMQAMLSAEVPIAFGVLTTYSDEQARVRSAADEHNKGREAAAACVESISLLRRIRAGD